MQNNTGLINVTLFHSILSSYDSSPNFTFDLTLPWLKQQTENDTISSDDAEVF